MTTTESPAREEALLSSTTRLVRAALDAVGHCPCGGAAGVRVLRGFDQESRDHARTLRERLGALRVPTTIEPVSVAALHLDRTPQEHVCALLDLTVGASEADRLAAHRGTPLVTLAPTLDLGGEVTSRSALRASFSAHDAGLSTFPSAVGRIPHIAFDTFLLVPNQPETGQLTARITDATWRSLRPGTAISARALPEVILVEAIDVHGSAETWFTERLEVRQVAGLHQIHRDQLCVADLADRLTITHQPSALWAHLA